MKKKAKLKKAGLLLVLVPMVFWIHNWLASNYVFVENYGISFGLNGLNNVFYLIILAYLIFIYFKFNNLGSSVIATGGMINFLDRFHYGFVRDYWSLGWGIYNNVNDWLIAAGVLLFIVEIWRQK